MTKTSNARRFPGETNRNRPDRAEARRLEADARQHATDAETPQQRLSRLDIKFGVGKGAAKERTRLLAMIAGGTASRPANNAVAAPKTDLSEAVLQEIDALNEDGGGKKRLKAKDRRAKEHQS